jgi:hypothetical protein
MLNEYTGTNRRHLSQIQGSLGEASRRSLQERIRQATQTTAPPAHCRISRLQNRVKTSTLLGREGRGLVKRSFRRSQIWRQVVKDEWTTLVAIPSVTLIRVWHPVRSRPGVPGGKGEVVIRRGSPGSYGGLKALHSVVETCILWCFGPALNSVHTLAGVVEIQSHLITLHHEARE